MTVDGVNNSLRWDDLRELVKEEFGDTISPPATQVHHLATPERHPLQQASSNINDIHPSQQYVASTGIQQPTATTCQVRIQHHGHPQISLLKQQEWQSSPGRVIEWQNFSPQARGPLLHRHVTASQDYHLRGDGYQLSGRENNRNQVSKNSRYYVENRVSSAQFAASKAKSTGSFMFDGRVSGSEFRSRTEELNSASDDRSAYRLQPERSESHDVNAIRALRDLSMRYHESSGHRHQRTVSEPSSPMAASSHLRPQIYHPSRSFSFSGIQEERKPTSRHESEPHAPRTPTQPVVHRVSRMVTLKDRIDQQIKEFEISFQDAPSGMNEDEQQLSGQASTDPDCVRDQVLLIGEEELVRREVLNPWERHGIHEEKPLKDVVVSPSERATSPSSQSVFIPMLQADALDGWGANYSSPIREPVSTATSSTDRSSFSASSEHHNTTIQFREGSEWVGFGEEIGEGKGYDDESSPQFCIPSPGRHSNATTHIPSQHSNATSSSGQSLFASLSQGVNVRESSDWTAFNDEENTDGTMKLPSITVGGTARDIAQDVQNSSNVLGDVGISVIVEVGSGAGFLRVSDVAPDSSAEASGDVHRGDIVISADGTDLTGTEAVLRGFTKAIQGPVGTFVSLCLMDPNEMRPRNLRLPRTPKSINPVTKFAERQRQLISSLQALDKDPHDSEALAKATLRLCTPGSYKVVPKILVVGSRGHGRSSLVTSLLSLLAGTRTRPASFEGCSQRHEDAFLGINIERVVVTVAKDQQPMEITISCALDELESDQEAEAVLLALMSGKYGSQETVSERREKMQLGEGVTVTTGPVDAVVLVQDCRVTPRPEVLRALRAATRECGELPIVVALTKMEDAALYCTDMEGMVAKMASVLSKASFFPIALGSEGHRGDEMCRDASRMAVLQLFERARSMGTHQALFGQREATWQQSCDFYM